MATYISIETDKKISYQIDGGDKQTMFANIEDDGYPEPTGTITITQNGTGIDVKNYAEADVNVPEGGYPEPTGTITITENGTGIDVKDYAEADVTVPTYPEPTGTKQISITQNGTTTENVKDYASAEITVNVSGGNNYTQGTFTVSADKTKAVTVAHGLGKMPKFAIFFPVDVHTSDAASGYYEICGMVLFDGVGQADFNIVDGATTHYAKAVALLMYTFPNNANNRATTTGIGLDGSNGTFVDQFMGYADSTNIILGGINETASGGYLAAGTYGYIIG